MKRWFYKMRLKAAMLRIYNDPASCGHSMLKVFRPELYANARKWYYRLKAADPNCPNIPEWLK